MIVPVSNPWPIPTTLLEWHYRGFCSAWPYLYFMGKPNGMFQQAVGCGRRATCEDEICLPYIKATLLETMRRFTPSELKTT